MPHEPHIWGSSPFGESPATFFLLGALPTRPKTTKENPMTDGEMEEKFRSMAQKHLSAHRVDRLLRQLWALESVPKIGELIAATRA